MRYPADHKESVRQRIVQAASRRFRSEGGQAVAIADLMSDLKLTHGGFYRHFKGKEDLFRAAFLAAAGESQARLTTAAEQAPSGRQLEAIITTYLSQGHCDDPGHGCPFAALAGEMSRHPRSTRATMDHAIREHAAAMSPFMPGTSLADREQNAIVLFSAMAGTLTLARATADPAQRRALLETARKFYIKAFGRAA